MRSKAVLLPGVKVTLDVETGRKIETQTWNYPEGIKGYFAELMGGLAPVAETFLGERYSRGRSRRPTASPTGEGARWAFACRRGRRGSASPTPT